MVAEEFISATNGKTTIQVSRNGLSRMDMIQKQKEVNAQ